LGGGGGGRAGGGEGGRPRGVIPCRGGPPGAHNKPPPPQILASGSRRCRTPRRVALCLGANLSIASDHDDRAFRPGRVDGRDWTGHGRGNADDAWYAIWAGTVFAIDEIAKGHAASRSNAPRNSPGPSSSS